MVERGKENESKIALDRQPDRLAICRSISGKAHLTNTGALYHNFKRVMTCMKKEASNLLSFW